MPLVDQALYVEAQAVGAAWQFKARCYVEDPAGSMNWRRGQLGEVEVKFVFLGEWWQLSKELETKNCDANGEVLFAGSWASGSYTMEAKHNVSGDINKVRIETSDDGTWTSETEIQ